MAAALQTIRHIGDSDALDEAVDDAFPGGRVSIAFDDGWFEIEMQQHAAVPVVGRGLHPDLLPPLGRLIAQTAHRSQVIVVSHAAALIDSLQQLPECHSIALEKKLGQTTLAGDDYETVAWHWPAR